MKRISLKVYVPMSKVNIKLLPAPGNFLLIMLPGKRRLEMFLVQAAHVENDRIHVSFMKQVSKRTFVWPEIEDVHPVSLFDVSCVVHDVTLDPRSSTFTTSFDV